MDFLDPLVNLISALLALIALIPDSIFLWEGHQTCHPYVSPPFLTHNCLLFLHNSDSDPQREKGTKRRLGKHICKHICRESRWPRPS